MNPGVILIGILVAIIAILVGFRILAGMQNGVGRVFRWFWNTSFKFAAFMPFAGWMTRFMIGEEREIWIAIGATTDSMAWDAVNAKAEQNRLEQARVEAVRKKAAEQGYTDVSVNSDGTFATAVDSNGFPVNITVNFKDK